ncbi:hypothetical protein DM39_4767 [Burkholderia cenocepacia]|uniref:Uncharacterized protein n=1 Tax=Burkholderia cenocepacia TaxID=95486 RepID=A0AAN0RWL1_9BURK|nr:hypothetical protein DM39_4767 [Burkholderia cenocepacia]
MAVSRDAQRCGLTRVSGCPMYRRQARAAIRVRRGLFWVKRGKTVRHMEKVFALLLDFATLPEKSRRDFLARINEFLIMSPLQKRQAIDEWKLVAENRRDERGDDSDER